MDEIFVAHVLDDWCVQTRQRAIKATNVDYNVVEGIMRFKG